ncbi:MAG: OmpA family protein [Saprospiraceae bacterium]
MFYRLLFHNATGHARALKPFSTGMAHIFFSIAFLVVFSSRTFCQNLVVNPGFEETNDTIPFCKYMKKGPDFNRIMKGWNTFTGLTPDLVFFPSGDSMACIYPPPRSGNTMVGIILYHPELDTGYDYDYHEFIQGTLKNSLVPGQQYQIEFYIQQDNSVAIDHLKQVYSKRVSIFPTACNNLGFYFLTEKLDEKTQMDRLLRKEEVTPQFNIDEIIETPKNEWARITGTFVTDRPCQYFIIGNFFSDKSTENTLPINHKVEEHNLKYNSFWRKIKRVAYYCIDDISITAADAPVQTTIDRIAESIGSNRSYTFRNVNFESAKWDLPTSCFEELDALSALLKKDASLVVEIGGHTDNVGNVATNELLSAQRAEAVYNYLLSKGVPKNNMTFKGYGESNPVATNGTPEGRRKNRRVECRIAE